MAELDLSVAFSSISKHLDTIKKQGVRPIHRRIHGSGLTIASGLGDYGLVECTQQAPVGRIWNLRAVHLLASANPQSPLSSGPSVLPESVGGAFNVGYYDQGTVSTIGTAAAGGTLTLPFAYTTAWRVDPAAAWPAGTNQVTITNLNGGTQTYDLPGGTTNSLIVAYPEPIPAPFGQPVITVPAIVGGPAYTINAYGRNLGNNVINTAVDIFVGEPPISGAPPTAANSGNVYPSLEGLVDSNLGPMPIHKEYKDGVHWMHHGDKLFAIFNNVPGATQQVAMLAEIDDWAIADVEATIA